MSWARGDGRGESEERVIKMNEKKMIKSIERERWKIQQFRMF